MTNTTATANPRYTGPAHLARLAAEAPSFKVDLTRNGRGLRVATEVIDTLSSRRGLRMRACCYGIAPYYGEGRMFAACEFGGTVTKSTPEAVITRCEREVARLEREGWTRV
jgi:hypothetical protein